MAGKKAGKKTKKHKEMKKMFMYLVLFIIISSLVLLSFWHPKVHFSQNTISKIDTKEKVLILTFDDGPGEQTGEILNILAEKKVSATFFLVGERLEWYENETRKIISEEQEIGTHGYSHKFALFGGKEDFIKGKEVIEQKVGEVQWYRPPYGLRTIRLVREVKKQDKTIVLWDIMPKDFLGWKAEKISKYTIQRIRPGSIIVLHDGPEEREETAKALPIIIDEARAQGYEFITLSEGLNIEEAEHS